MLSLLEGQAFLDWELLSPPKELAIKLGFCFVLIREKNNLMSFPRETGLATISTRSRAECQECGGPARQAQGQESHRLSLLPGDAERRQIKRSVSSLKVRCWQEDFFFLTNYKTMPSISAFATNQI